MPYRKSTVYKFLVQQKAYGGVYLEGKKEIRI